MTRHAISLQRQCNPQIPHERPRRTQPGLELIRARQHRLQPLQRLADDPAHPAAGRLRRLARPHGDGRQPQGEGVDEAAPVVVVEHRLDHQLLRPVAGLRRAHGAFCRERRERLPEIRRARTIDAPHPRTRRANRLEQVQGRVEIHAVAEGEIGFAARRHDAVEDVDSVQVGREHAGGGLVEVGLDSCGPSCIRGRGRDGWEEDVGEDELVAICEEVLRQELTYKPASTGDEDFHDRCCSRDNLVRGCCRKRRQKGFDRGERRRARRSEDNDDAVYLAADPKSGVW
nr:hypothetical protein CFP56_00519 [Quercus suber]